MKRSEMDVSSSALFDLVSYLAEQRDWSTKTFGPGPRLRGIAEHVGKELAEVTGACTPQEALEEWCDIAILALDGAWRAGYTPEQVCEQLRRKAAVNRARQWPPPGPQDRANEHVRSKRREPETRPSEVRSDALLGGSYWDRTDRAVWAGMTPKCPMCGSEMFPADDHGRFTCFCDLGRVTQL